MAPREFFDEQHVQRSYERVLKDVEAYRALGRTALQAIEFGNATFEARDYQREAWEALRLAREDGKDSALVHLATGLGKTTIGVVDALDFAVDFHEREGRPPKIMFAVHQTEILNQAAERFKEFAPSLSHGVYAAGRKSTDHPLTFATMQSLAQNLDSLDPSEFDYILYDEAHHTQAQTYREVVEYFTPEFKLALTATPERMDEEDIRDLFGHEVYSKPLSKAMAEGHLVDVNYHIVFDDAVKRAIDSGFTPRTLNEIRELLTNESRNEQIVAQIQAEKQRLGIENAKTIVFCHNIEQANEMAELLDGRPYHSAVGAEREQTLRAFRDGDLQTITTRDMFNEGIDVPDAQLLIFLRSTSSQTVFEQQLGRGLRKHPGKEAVSVLDFVANIERLTQVKNLSDSIMQHQSRHGGKASTDKHRGGLQVHAEHADFDFDKLSLSLIEKYLRIQERSARQIPETIEEAAELWRKNFGDTKPTANNIVEASANGLFVSFTVLNRLGGIASLRVVLGFEELKNQEAETIEEAAELWRKNFGDTKPTKQGVIDAIREKRFIRSTRLHELGGLRALKQATGFNTFDRPTVASLEEAAELWRKNFGDEEPTQAKIRQAIKMGQFVSKQTIQKHGGMEALKQELGFTVRPVVSSIQEAAELWRKNFGDEEPTTDKILQASLEDKYISKSRIVQLGGMEALKQELGFTVRPVVSSIQEAAELWRKNFGDEEPTEKLIARAHESGGFISLNSLYRIGSLSTLKKELGFTVRPVVSSIQEAAELWRKNFGDEEPTTRQLIKASKDRSFISMGKLNDIGGVNGLRKELGYAVRPVASSIQEAAELWRKNFGDEEPTQEKIARASKSNLYISASAITSFGGLAALKTALYNLR